MISIIIFYCKQQQKWSQINICKKSFLVTIAFNKKQATNRPLQPLRKTKLHKETIEENLKNAHLASLVELNLQLDKKLPFSLRGRQR